MGIKGKHFLIVNKPTGLVLDIQGESRSSGSQVVVWEKQGSDTQIWWADPVTGTIRNKHDGLCLDLNDANRLIVNNFQHGDANQQWRYNKKRKTIESRSNPDKVLDIVGESTNKGAEICSWDHHGRGNQQWKLEMLPIKYFFVKSGLNGKVLDIEGGNGNPGAKVIMYQQNGRDAENQLWFEDCFGNIRSKLNPKLVLDGRSGTLHTTKWDDDDEPTENRTHWCIQGNKIVNRHNHDEVLDIKGRNADDGAELCVWNYHGDKNQEWHFEYV